MTARFYGLLTASLLALSPASLAQPTTTGSFDSNGVQIQYADRGSGEPVVLIHGFTGSYARHIESPGLMDRLDKAGYRSIAIDCRGHGQSGKPRDDSAYGMEMVADVIRLMDHLKIERAHLFGYSMGGAIVSQLLVRQPTRVLTATLLGAGWEGEDLTAFRSQMEELADGFARRDASALIRGVTSGQKPPTDAEVAALNESLFARNDHQALAAVARGTTSLFGRSSRKASDDHHPGARHRRRARCLQPHRGEAHGDGGAEDGSGRAPRRQSRHQRQAVGRSSDRVSGKAPHQLVDCSGHFWSAPADSPPVCQVPRTLATNCPIPQPPARALLLGRACSAARTLAPV